MSHLLDSVAQVCRAHGADLMELYEVLYASLPEMVPEGHRLATCGNCRRHGIIPSGSVLRKLREGCHLTQREVSELAGVSVPHICDVEAGRKNATDVVVAAYRGLMNGAAG